MTSETSGINIEKFEGGDIKLSSEIIHLKDLSACVKVVHRFEDFVRILSHLTNPLDLTLFVGGGQVNAWRNTDLLEWRRERQPVARLILLDHPVLQRLQSGIGKEFNKNDFVKFLSSFRRFLDPLGDHLLLKARDLQIAKKLSFQSVKANGNFKYTVQMDSDTGDFIPPETVVFTIPIFQHIDQPGRFETDFHFEVEVGKENASTSWKLESLTWAEDKLDVTTQVLTSLFADAGVESPIFSGSVQHIEADDSWSVVQNRSNELRKLK
jgi:hypothetical protein